jgi:hypothetical protein
MALPEDASGDGKSDVDAILDIVVQHPQKVNLDGSRILGTRIILEEMLEDVYSCGSPDYKNDRLCFLAKTRNCANGGVYHAQRLDGSCIDGVGIYSRVCAMSTKNKKARHRENVWCIIIIVVALLL